ncbi:MAG: bifunctional precorrin-2 dehydrogenase/sirohydrochlorin ferrochelatase [Thermodesulfobacteriota bacterium]
MFLNLHGKKCVVIGGGKVALRKIKMLLECRADVSVISPRVHRDIAKLSSQGAIRLIQRDYAVGDLKGAVIAFACTDLEDINRKVAGEANRSRVLVNVVDDSELSDLIVPSFFRRGNLTVAVSTSGVSPALARKIRTELQENFGKEYGSLLSLIGEVRSALKEKGYKIGRGTWQEALDLDSLLQLLRSGKKKKAKTILLNKLKTNSADYLKKK